MKTFLAALGAVLLLAVIAGAVGLVDFRLCIAQVGGCGWTVDRGTPVVDPSPTMTRLQARPESETT